MKLLSQILFRLSIALFVVLAVWGVLFYVTMVDEITDEVDDALEEYAEQLISRSLAGVEMPTQTDGSNNSYYIREVPKAYAKKQKGITYEDAMLYIASKNETEPARLLTTIFTNEKGQYFELTVSTPTIEKHDVTEAILYWTIFLYVALLLVILCINIWVYYGSMKPLRTLLGWFDNYTIGSPNAPLENKTNIVEFQKLNSAVLRSVERSEQIFEQQKEFIGNASHEIQTPLAICRNRLEVLSNSHLTEQQMHEVLKTQQTLAHITKLNKSLLFLSKIDNHQFSEKGVVDVGGQLQSLQADFSEVYGSKNIHFKSTNNGAFTVEMNETLATALVTNLLKNAYVHTPPNGTIATTTTAYHLLVENSGSEPLDETMLFSRFYQGSRREGSTGLGLAIVKAICQTYRLEIRYCFYNRMHQFRVTKR